MKSLLSSMVLAVVLTVVSGCETPMRDIITLPGEGAGQAPQMISVPEKGTYYLYSSKDPKKVIFKKDLKKGEELGFSVHGDRAEAKAAGAIIQLDDYSEGSSYTWKIEEKDKDKK